MAKMKQETRRDKTKKKILKAALIEFSQKGLDGARIDNIANIAKVNKQRIYVYFGNKEALYTTILKENYMLIVEEEEYFLKLTEKDLPKLAEKILELYFKFHESTPSFWRMLNWENLNGGTHTQKLNKFRTKSFEHLRKLYSKGQENGAFKSNVSFESFIFILTSVSFFYFSNQLTMTKTMNTNLKNTAEKIIKETIALIK